MVIVTVRLVEGHQVPSHYGTALCNNSRLLHSAVKKKMTGFVTRFRGADHTQPPVGHQVMELVDLG